MYKRTIVAAIAALAISPALSFAADAPAKPAAGTPPAPAELAALDFFVGTWNCTGKAFASPMGPEHETAASVHATKSVGDRWIQINYDENKTATNPTPYHVGVYMGYDAGAKKFVQGCVDNMGGYCTQSSGGWNGDVITFEGTANGSGQAMGVRDTFIRKGTKELVHAGEIQGADKQWAQTDKETCKRK
jgi:hypothetical protein